MLLLIGEVGLLSWISSGGSFSLVVLVGVVVVIFDSGIVGFGVELFFSVCEICLDSVVLLFSGKLSLSVEDDLELGDGVCIDLVGCKVSFNDVDKYSWGGDLLLSSCVGDICQVVGLLIDLLVCNNCGGILSVVVLVEDVGVVDLQGCILGGVSGDYDVGGICVLFFGGELEICVQCLGDGGSLSEQFIVLNQCLNQGEVFGVWCFQFK